MPLYRLTGNDDGTNYELQVNGTTILEINKTTKQMRISGGVSLDETI